MTVAVPRKSIKMNQLVRRGKPYQWQQTIIVPRHPGRTSRRREEFTLNYMRELFDAFDKCLLDVRGMMKRYRADI